MEVRDSKQKETASRKRQQDEKRQKDREIEKQRASSRASYCLRTPCHQPCTLESQIVAHLRQVVSCSRGCLYTRNISLKRFGGHMDRRIRRALNDRDEGGRERMTMTEEGRVVISRIYYSL